MVFEQGSHSFPASKLEDSYCVSSRVSSLQHLNWAKVLHNRSTAPSSFTKDDFKLTMKTTEELLIESC